MALSSLRTETDRFLDADGRQILLRGVNLGGDSKVPFPNGGTQYPGDFSNHREVSFVGRPFPLDEADQHLARLRHWGFNCIRLITTWEAIEHAGPGRYDREYLDYFEAICRKAGEFDLYVIVDFHQDVWSRATGGDGAPMWLFEATGLDYRVFDEADAAHVMQYRYDYGDAEARQAGYPQMSWHINYRLPANGIMWTLFWAGQIVTPEFLIDGVNVQTFLQGHFFGAVEQVARRVAGLAHVIGFDILNEPGMGWVGQPLSKIPSGAVVHGPVVTPLAALGMARGLPTPIRVKDTLSSEGVEQTFNRAARSIWREGVECPFERAGTYRVKDGRIEPLNERAFDTVDGRPLDIANDVLAPFFAEAALRVRQVRENWLVFCELDPFSVYTGARFPAAMPSNWVNANHWYDLSILVTKTFHPDVSIDVLTGDRIEGPVELRKRYIQGLSLVKSLATASSGNVPTLIGEFGIPFDLNGGGAYADWAAGNKKAFDLHAMALELMYEALDSLLLCSTQWNYSAGNRNDLRIGDQWNQEDLSIFSVDQIDNSRNLDAGGRAIEGFARPYARATQGVLKSQNFDRQSGKFLVEYHANPNIDAPTEIVLPAVQFGSDIAITCSDQAGRYEVDATRNVVRIWASSSGIVRVACQRYRRNEKTAALGTGTVVDQLSSIVHFSARIDS